MHSLEQKVNEKYELIGKIEELIGMSKGDAVDLIDAINGKDLNGFRCQFAWFLKCCVDYKRIKKNKYKDFILLLSKMFEGRYDIVSYFDEMNEGFDVILMPCVGTDDGFIVSVCRASNCENLGLNNLAQNVLNDMYTKGYSEKMREKHIHEVFSYGVVYCLHKVAVATSLQYNFY